MAENRGQLLHDYFHNLPLKKSLTSKYRTSNSWMSNANHGFTPSDGDRRFWYDDTTLYSYAMPLITRLDVGKEIYLLNGDGAPTVTTAKHQGDLRRAVNRHLKRENWAIVPFSALESAGIKPGELKIIHTTPDRVETFWRRCASKYCGLRDLDEYLKKNSSDTKWSEDKTLHDHRGEHHFLGETLFKIQRSEGWHYYVCGLDRNDNPRRRMFFLAQIPLGKKPKTVDEALDMLRPEEVALGAPRQGEWFFLPVDIKADRMGEVDWQKFFGLSAGEAIEIETEKTKIAKVDPEEAKYVYRRKAAWLRETKERRSVYASLDARSFDRRHYAPIIVHVRFKDQHEMFVRGCIRDAEHDTLKLAKGWHRVVKNLAVRGWRAGGGQRARVD